MPTAQKCMKLQLRRAVDHVIVQSANADAFCRRARAIGFTSSPVITKSPVAATFPDPADWKLNAVAIPIAGGIAAPIIVIGSGRGIEIDRTPPRSVPVRPSTFWITSAFNSGSAACAGAAAPAAGAGVRPASPSPQGGMERGPPVLRPRRVPRNGDT